PIIDIRAARYEPTGDEEHDVRELTRMIMSALERFVREYPEQWYIFRRMWPELPERAARGAAMREA
ncbi:MAG: hypothetical protein U1B78_01925, partial [Dehalococcoidia bacterium]|nr:hypothetical protein [Dehalococcoidia bacterium]